MNIRAGRILAAAGAATVFTLAGCGDGNDAGTAAKATAASTAPSAAAAADAPAGSLGDVLSRTVREGRSAHVTIDLGRQGGGEGDITFGDGSPAMQMHVSFGSRKTEVRLVDGKLYVAVPGRDGKFMKMDLGRAGAALGVDPAQALGELQAKSGDFKEVADGHWRATHDGTTTDVLVGADGFPAKVQVTGQGERTMTTTFSDWGKKVTVEAPAAGALVARPMM